MICNSCGHESQGNEKFCRECGAPLEAPAPEAAASDVAGAAAAPASEFAPEAAAPAVEDTAVAAEAAPVAAAVVEPQPEPQMQPQAAEDLTHMKSPGLQQTPQPSSQGGPAGTAPVQQQDPSATATQPYGAPPIPQAGAQQVPQGQAQPYGGQPGQQPYGGQQGQQPYGAQPPVQQQSDQAKNNKTLKIVLIVVAAVLVLCCICFFAFGSCVSSVLKSDSGNVTTSNTNSGTANSGSSGTSTGTQGSSKASEPGVSDLTIYQSTASNWIQDYEGRVYYSNPSYIAGKDALIPDAKKIPVDTQQFSICDDYIYYTKLPDGSGDDRGPLYRVKLDGTGQTQLADDCSLWDSFYLVDDKLYYNGYSGTKSGVFCVDLDGKGKPEAVSQMARVVAANFDSIFYTKAGTSGAFICDNDLKNEKQLTTGSYARYFIDCNNQLYEFIETSNVFYGYSETGQQILKIAPAVSGSYFYTDGTTLYLCDGGYVYIYALATGDCINSHIVANDIFYVIYSDLSDIYYVVVDEGSTTASGEMVNCYLYYEPVSGGQRTQLASWFSS